MNIGIVGATGLVGEKLLAILEERNFPINQLMLFSSEKSAGQKISFKGEEIEVKSLSKDCFKNLDLVFFALDDKLAKEWIPIARKECIVIDKSSAYRLDKEVPLIVPEVNGHQLKEHKNLIANPNCTTIPLVMVLAPLHQTFGLKRVIVSTYQSVSGAGRNAIEEYLYEIEVLAYGDKISKDKEAVFPAPIAANLIPQIGKFDKDGYSSEERKVIEETRKILQLPQLPISATCVRVPCKIGHCEAVNIEFAQAVDISKVKKTLKTAGLVVMDDEAYPMPVNIENSDNVYVGRIRKDHAFDNGIVLWLGTDNLRKGAATNAVQIAELLLKEKNIVK